MMGSRLFIVFAIAVAFAVAVTSRGAGTLQNGTLRMYSDLSTCDLMETNATYPGGQKKRDTITSPYCLRCTSCDSNRKREVCISDYCVHLGDRAVFIFSDNGTLRKTLPLTCSPQYLHLSTVSENLIFIVCEGQSQYLELDDYTGQFPAPTTISGSSLIFASGHDEDFYPRDFMLYLRNNFINLEVHQDSAPTRQLRSPSECDTLTMLHPRAARGNEIQFLLDCTTESNITKRFNVIENRYEGSSTFTEIHDATGIPIDSPNGSYIAIIHNDSLTIYNASDLQQYPGTKTFAGHIWGVDFLNSSQLLVVVPGKNHTLVDIPVFVQSEGLRGVAELPSTIAYCPTGGTCLPHKLINRNTLLVFTRNGNVYDALFYTTADPIQRLGAVQGFLERPQVAFFNSQPAVNTTPTLNNTSSSETSPVPTLPGAEPITTPTSSPAMPLLSSSPPTLPSSSSSPPTLPSTSSPPPTLPPASSPPTLPPASSPPTLPYTSPPTGSSEAMDNATNPTISSGTKEETVSVIVAVVLVTVAFLTILVTVFFYIWKRKRNSPTNKEEYSKEEKMVMACQQGEESNPRLPPTGGLSTQDLNLQTAPTNSPPTLVTPSDQTSEYSSAGSSPILSSNHLQPPASMPRPGSSCSMTSSSGVSGSGRSSVCDGTSVQGEAAVLTRIDTADEQTCAIKYTAQFKHELVTGQNASTVDLLRQKNDAL